MPVVMAVWPNSTVSVLQFPRGFSMTDVFWQLDDEADPLLARLYLVSTEDGCSHAAFDFDLADEPHREKGVIRVKARSGKVECHHGRVKRLKWPRGMIRIAYRSLGSDRRRHDYDKAQVATMTAEQIADMPAEPTKTYSVDEIRKMEPFCGVYFAFNDDGTCHYVGESCNVTSRVASSREEIGRRQIGVVRCEPHERKRIEAYFIAMLDPPGNAVSTHKMKAKGKDAHVSQTA